MLAPIIRAAQLATVFGLATWFPAAGAQQSDLELRMQDSAQWPMPARDYANTRFSALDQINIGNAGQLQLAWTFSVGVDRGQEAAPIIVDGNMYVVGPYDG